MRNYARVGETSSTTTGTFLRGFFSVRFANGQPLIATEYKFVVMIPTTFFSVDAGFQIGRRDCAGGAGRATAGQIESLILKHVECLLDGRMFQIKPCRITIRFAVIRIATFV